MAIKDDMQDVQEAVINELITENGITNTLADGQVTETKILNDAVTTNKIANGAVTATKLGSDVDLTPADGSITPAKLDRAYLESTGGTVSGSVGIGDSTPTDSAGFGIALDVSSSTGAAVYVRDSGGSKTGHLGQFNEQTSIVSRQDDGNIAFYIGASPSERMRIDSSGNLLVGKAVQSIATVGVTVVNGQVTATADGADAIRLNRKSSDGSIVDLRKDGTTVGSIGANGTKMYTGSGATGLYFNRDDASIEPYNPSTITTRDAAIDLGSSDERFKDLYLSNIIKISDSSEPSTPSGGGVLYVQNGALKFKGSSGTVTTIANA